MIFRAFPQGSMGRERPPPGDGTVSAHQPAPLCRSGRQKGGGAPVLLIISGSAPTSREPRHNCNGHSRLERHVRAHRKTSFVHMPPIVPCALPDRHETHFSAVKISLQKTSCPPTVMAVDDLADGAVFCQRLQLDGSFQRGRHAAAGVENRASPVSAGIGLVHRGALRGLASSRTAVFTAE